MTRSGLLLPGIAALVYVTVPGHPLGWLTGVPLRPLALAAAVVIGIGLFAFWPLTQGRSSRPMHVVGGVLLGLAALKLILWSVAPAYGVPGWYFANSRFQGTPERSSDFPGAEATRRDRELNYGGDEFPVHFLNDSQRFNFYGAEADRRKNLPFSVRWRGTLYVPGDGSYRFWLTASGPAALMIDGRRIASADADGRETVDVSIPLARGSHDLQVTYARRPPRSPDLKVHWELDGRRQPLAIPYLLAAPITSDAWDRDQLLGQVARGLDGLFLIGLGLGLVVLLAGRAVTIRRARAGRWALLERPLLGAFLLAIFAHAALPELDRADKMSLLGGGQDWLFHETLARDILINGPLMTLGKPLGEGRSFYAQPFYPYALAGIHWLTGEDQFGPTVLQLFGLGVAGVLLYYLAKRLFGLPAAFVTIGLFLGLREWQLDWVARRLLSENVYFVVIPALFIVLIRYLDERRRWDLVLAGLLFGLAIVTRGPTLLYLPLATLIVVVALRRDGQARARVALVTATLLVPALLVIGLVPLRNAIVAGEPALLASSGGVNLQKLHRPTPQVRLSEAQHRWYAPYIQDAPTRETLEFIQQDPVGYAATYWPLALYTLGYAAAIEESHIVWWPDLVALSLLYAVAIVALPRARSARALVLHAFVAVHFLTMVVFAPYDYDNRLVLPMYLPILVIAAYAVSSAAVATWTRVGSIVPRSSTLVGKVRTQDASRVQSS